MNRRQLLHLLGGVAVLPLAAPLAPDRRLALGRALHRRLAGRGLRTLNPAQDALVARIADIILPETDTPGASAARVNEFVDLLLGEWYPADERERFLTGLAEIDARSRQTYGAGFLELSPADQTVIVGLLDGERGPEASAAGAYRTLKGLTVYGYFTSELVVKEVLKTRVIPGRFDGCAEEPSHDD